MDSAGEGRKRGKTEEELGGYPFTFDATLDETRAR
jgi:hypothetical protein